MSSTTALPCSTCPLTTNRSNKPLRTLAWSLVDMLSDPSWKRLMPAIRVLLKAEMGTMAELDQDLKEQQFEVMVSVQRGVAEGYLRPRGRR